MTGGGTAVRRLAITLACVLAPAAAAAQEPLRAELAGVAAVDDSTVTVALRLAVEHGWYIYWTNPGDAGLPSRVQWTLPAGVRMVRTDWPTPARFGADSASLGYDGEVTVLATLVRDPAARRRRVALEAQVEWAACADVCIPGRSRVRGTLPQQGRARSPMAAAAARAAMPDDSAPWRMTAAAAGGEVRVRLHADGGSLPRAVDFFPAEAGHFRHDPPVIGREGEALVLRLPLASGASPPAVLRGVLAWEADGRRKAATVAIRVGAPAGARPVAASHEDAR